MLRVNKIPITPTIFPDGTSQVWHLPKEVLKDPEPTVDWRFGAEREILDVLSLRKLLSPRATLYVPFLPFSRQDKVVSNETTFNLRVMADLLNLASFKRVRTLDAHNPVIASWVGGLENELPHDFHLATFQKFKPDAVVFPDAGAAARYPYFNGIQKITLEKTRNQATGEITSLKVKEGVHRLDACLNLLMVDDICDGGATFIMAAKVLRELSKDCKIGLAVTHGIFSRGTEVLLKEGIQIFTTNSLPKNAGFYEV